jgi:hypothetical protein
VPREGGTYTKMTTPTTRRQTDNHFDGGCFSLAITTSPSRTGIGLQHLTSTCMNERSRARWSRQDTHRIGDAIERIKSGVGTVGRWARDTSMLARGHSRKS